MTTPEEEPQLTPDDTAFNEILRHYMASIEQQVEQARQTLKNEILPAFLPYGVASIEAAYSGYGDSGAIDGIQFRDSAGQRIERTSLPAETIEQLENCIYEFLPAGFEINDGSQGTVLIDTRTAKVTIRHQENYTEPRDTSREFDL